MSTSVKFLMLHVEEKFFCKHDYSEKVIYNLPPTPSHGQCQTLEHFEPTVAWSDQSYIFFHPCYKNIIFNIILTNHNNQLSPRRHTERNIIGWPWFWEAKFSCLDALSDTNQNSLDFFIHWLIMMGWHSPNKHLTTSNFPPLGISLATFLNRY